MASFKEFCDGVLREMPRATGGEKDSVREELLDHLMEHREMLVGHGYDLLEAERRAIAAMGDPEEIGRAWNEKLSPFWLWAGRIAKFICITLLVLNCTTLWFHVDEARENIWARTATVSELTEKFSGVVLKNKLIAAQELDIRREFGGQIVRIYRVELRTPEGVWKHYYPYDLMVYAVAYGKSPLDYALNGDVLRKLTCNGEYAYAAGGGDGLGSAHYRLTFHLDEGIENIRLALDHLGNHMAADVVLDWGGETA